MSGRAEVRGAFLRAQVLAGASAAQLFDSWAGELSLADYRAHAAPFSAQALAEVRDLDVPVVHFGTNTGELLAAMRDVGADVVGVDHRIGLDEANRRLGGRTVVQGNIDPALLAAPWPVLEAHVRDVLRRGAEAPAHVLNLGHGVPPSTDPDRADPDRPARARRAVSEQAGVVVVGGGVAGLVVAHRLARRGVPDHRARGRPAGRRGRDLARRRRHPAGRGRRLVRHPQPCRRRAGRRARPGDHPSRGVGRLGAPSRRHGAAAPRRDARDPRAAVGERRPPGDRLAGEPAGRPRPGAPARGRGPRRADDARRGRPRADGLARARPAGHARSPGACTPPTPTRSTWTRCSRGSAPRSPRRDRSARPSRACAGPRRPGLPWPGSAAGCTSCRPRWPRP